MVTGPLLHHGRTLGHLRKQFAAAIALVLLAAAAFGFRLALADLWWGTSHHWRATSFGETIDLPTGWRQMDRPDRKQRLDLRNAVASSLHLQIPDEISIWESPSAFDSVEEAQRWERLGTRLMVPGERLEPTPHDAFLVEHARCSDVKRLADGRINFACFDKEGTWAGVFLGREQEAKDLSRVLASVLRSSARRP